VRFGWYCVSVKTFPICYKALQVPMFCTTVALLVGCRTAHEIAGNEATRMSDNPTLIIHGSNQHLKRAGWKENEKTARVRV
jgi:hypothetical protein